MTQTQLAKVKATTAAELCVPIELAPESRAMMAPGTTPGQFLDSLVAAGSYDDAIKILAHGLPPREAVWWACVAARTVVEEDTEEQALAALKTAEAWTYEPTEPNRRLAEAAYEAEGYDHPSRWAAQAAFLCGPTVLPPDLPPVPPPPHMRGNMVSVAVQHSALIGTEPADPAGRFKALIAKGVDIANGGWGTDAPPAR